MFRALLTSRLQAAFTAAGIELPEGFLPNVVIASDTRYGDYQSNAAMVLAKQLKTNPRALAEQIKAALQVDDLCEKVTVDGPGFLNFTVGATALAQRLAVIVNDDHVGVPGVDSAKTIVVDFSAPNIAKPMHVGHIRSTFIGDSLARVARFIGHTVITDNHVGDWGTQFGMILWGLKQPGLKDSDRYAKDPINELVRIYKSVNALVKQDLELLKLKEDFGQNPDRKDALVMDAHDRQVREQCKAELVKLQSGDPENLAIWRECIDLSLSQLNKIYSTLDIKFDHYLGESFYNDALAPLVADMLNQGIATISDDATVVFSDGSVKPECDPFLIRDKDEWKAAPCIIRKGDGGFLYATTDLATIDHRVKEWKADEIWYVVGAPQQLHFRQVFAAAQRRGVTTQMTHIAFGSILGPDGKMFKTRSGETVGLLEVIDEAIERARAAADEKEQGLSAEDKDEIARIIGAGAVKYAELSQNRLTDYKFSWDKMLSMQGNTAPYLLNAYVRTRSIFRKLDGEVTLTPDLVLTEPAERALAMKLAQFAENTHDVLQDHRPNLLANYLYELADTYHSFYEACHVLRAEGTARNTRLTLCEATSRVLKTGLGLLGIQTTERM